MRQAIEAQRREGDEPGNHRLAPHPAMTVELFLPVDGGTLDRLDSTDTWAPVPAGWRCARMAK
jgi:hypothetical protein